jgi:hypothetical protein
MSDSLAKYMDSKFVPNAKEAEMTSQVTPVEDASKEGDC